MFTPSGLSKVAPSGKTILAAAHDAGVAIRSLCGGNGNCRQCWVKVVEGNHTKHGVRVAADHVSAPTELENRYRTKIARFKDMRLACRTHICGDVLIDVPESSQEHLTNISKSNASRDFSISSAFQLVDVALAEASMDDNPAATENILARLAEKGIKAQVNFHILSGLQKTIQDAKGLLTLVLRDGNEIVAVYPQGSHSILGAAVDIGSTTLAVYIHDLMSGKLLWESSAMNPQIKFGEDLMSRVSYVMMNKGGDSHLTAAVHTKLSEMFAAACSDLAVDKDKLLEVVLVGNPIMHHLFFGLSPVELGQAPFTVATRAWMQLDAAQLGIGLFPSTRLAFLPLIAGHVGADTAAAYLSEIETLRNQTSLLVDIGTNAEIVLSKDGAVFATSSPTGPAFEGAEISSGVRASHGAIERVRIDPETLAVTYKIIGVEEWSDHPDFVAANHRAIGICGSGIVEVMVCLARAGLIDKGGLFVQSRAPECFDQVGKTWRFLLVDQGESSIYIEQTDVRSIQLAKAALYAGVQLLMDYLECQEFDAVLLAGAFGTHLDPDYVADLDLIPQATKNNIRAVGNAAGVGATKALLDTRERDLIISEVRRIQKIESANEPKFQEYFVEGMKFSVSPVAGQKNQRNRRRRS